MYEMCTLRHAFNAKDMSSLVYKILKGKVPSSISYEYGFTLLKYMGIYEKQFRDATGHGTGHGKALQGQAILFQVIEN